MQRRPVKEHVFPVDPKLSNVMCCNVSEHQVVFGDKTGRLQSYFFDSKSK